MRLVLAAVGVAVLLHAQSGPRPAFDVASIKPCQEPVNDLGPHSSPGRLATDCAELLNLIGNAYTAFADGHLNHNSDPAPINGGPAWIHSASYEINATAEGNPSVAMMMGPMMQQLLEDRFQLKIHRQTIEGPVYFLTTARGGSKLRPFREGSCTPYSSLPRPALLPGTEYCESFIGGGKSPSVTATGVTLDEFSKTLRVLLDRPVINKTGIGGRFDIHVRFTEVAPQVNESDPTASSSIFDALQDQLGLKLESGRGPIETLVIDHIERPSGN
ncbi:MAG TPA: TIGR03435 family protein [Bryobacteraceae bacterium]|nr:TIGR03435 family protein [Bryobacteraceae bacterium]